LQRAQFPLRAIWVPIDESLRFHKSRPHKRLNPAHHLQGYALQVMGARHSLACDAEGGGAEAPLRGEAPLSPLPRPLRWTDSAFH
jgi:hypothetical protein